MVAGARTVDSLAGSTVSAWSRSTWRRPTAPPGSSRTPSTARKARHLVNNVGGVRPRLDGFVQIDGRGFRSVLPAELLRGASATRLPSRRCCHGQRARSSTSPRSTRPSSRTARHRLWSRQGRAPERREGALAGLGPQGSRSTVFPPARSQPTSGWERRHRGRRRTGEGVDPDDVRAQATAGIPTGRFSTPEEVATLVVFLASPRTANVNGANYVIDGGLVKTM